MRYKGLLTFEEADKCIAEGYDPDSLVAYRLDGYSVRVYQYDTQWYTDDDKVDAKDYQGLAPTLGNPLPMNTVRKDGREVILVTRGGISLAAHYSEQKEGFLGESGSAYDVEDFYGWYPSVLRED